MVKGFNEAWRDSGRKESEISIRYQYKYNYTPITRQRFYLCVSMPIPANATFCSFTIQRYGKVELIDTTNGIFMSLTEAK